MRPTCARSPAAAGEYTMEFVRYEEVPSHLAQKVISAATQEEEAAAKA